MKKVYAVRKGRKTGLFLTWAECESQVKGYNGAEYKSFPDNESALVYLENSKKIVQNLENHLKVYVDGSYSKALNRAGYGCVFIENNEIIYKISQAVSINLEENLWNVTAEIEGVLAAVEWAIQNKYKDISLHYDYEGLEKWFDGSWKANKQTTKSYINRMKNYNNKINIHFVKVKAHSGDYFNEMVDSLAKSSLKIDTEKKALIQENYIKLSLPKFKKIVGEIENEESLICIENFGINDYVLKKIAKKYWRDQKYLIKDMGKMRIRVNARESIIDLEIAHKKEKPILKVQIKLESDGL